MLTWLPGRKPAITRPLGAFTIGTRGWFAPSWPDRPALQSVCFENCRVSLSCGRRVTFAGRFDCEFQAPCLPARKKSSRTESKSGSEWRRKVRAKSSVRKGHCRERSGHRIRTCFTSSGERSLLSDSQWFSCDSARRRPPLHSGLLKEVALASTFS